MTTEPACGRAGEQACRQVTEIMTIILERANTMAHMRWPSELDTGIDAIDEPR